MRVTRWTAILAGTAATMAVAGAGPAGAANGQTERGPEHANSICSFSGLNDDPEAEFPEGGLTQSYGQLVRQGLKSAVPSPSQLCNGHLVPWQEVGGGGGH